MSACLQRVVVLLQTQTKVVKASDLKLLLHRNPVRIRRGERVKQSIAPTFIRDLKGSTGKLSAKALECSDMIDSITALTQTEVDKAVVQHQGRAITLGIRSFDCLPGFSRCGCALQVAVGLLMGQSTHDHCTDCTRLLVKAIPVPCICCIWSHCLTCNVVPKSGVLDHV
jgi:hypothetical protein